MADWRDALRVPNQALASLAEVVDLSRLHVALLLVVLVLILGRPLSRLARWILQRALQFFGIGLPTAFDEATRDVIFTAMFALSVLNIIAASDVSDPTRRAFTLITLTLVVLHLFVVAFRVASQVIADITPRAAASSRAWITQVVQVVIVVLACVSVLEIWGVHISGALAGVGVFGAGLAFALQDFIQNLTAGLTNASERRFRKGDWIEAGEVEGVVQHISLRSTTVMGFDRVPRFVPNKSLSDVALLNKSRIDSYRIYWVIPLTMDSSNAQIEQFCAKVRMYVGHSGEFVVDGSKTCLVLPTGMSESAIEIMIYVYCRTADWIVWLEMRGRLLDAIRDALAESGTNIAYPTGTVNLRSTAVTTASPKLSAEQFEATLRKPTGPLSESHDDAEQNKENEGGEA